MTSWESEKENMFASLYNRLVIIPNTYLDEMVPAWQFMLALLIAAITMMLFSDNGALVWFAVIGLWRMLPKLYTPTTTKQ